MTHDPKQWEEQLRDALPQAILGALEYRGFSDAGKYLDETVWERAMPLIHAAVESELQRARRCQRTVEEGAVCGVKLDCHIHDWRAPYPSQI